MLSKKLLLVCVSCLALTACSVDEILLMKLLRLTSKLVMVLLL